MVANVTAEQIEAKKARVAEALRLHDEGLSIKQTAERMGVAHETVRRYLRANGIPFVKKPTNKGTRKLPCGSASLCPAAAVMLFADGMTQTMIANMFGCSQNAVSHALRKRNVSTSRGRRPDTAKRERAVEMAGAGKSYYEIADALQVSHATVSKWARAAGIVRGKGGGCVARNNAARSSKAAPKRMARVRDAIGESFEVVRETRRDWFLLRCRECGHEFERYVDLHYPTTCPECQRREAEQRAAERREREGKRALMQRLVNILAYEHVCPECGARFRSSNPSQLYCSTRCRIKRKGYSDHETRAKKFGVRFDRSITLGGLIRRDGLDCYICGKTCDPNDKRWGSFGPDYPTIDCVTALSNGGSFTWDNVRVACGECNCARKGAKDVSELLAG